MTRRAWNENPFPAEPPYVRMSTKLRNRIGQLVKDMFGLCSTREDGGSSAGGQRLFGWATANNVNPLDLHFAWIEGTQCHCCLEYRMYQHLKPAGTLLNRKPIDIRAEHKL